VFTTGVGQARRHFELLRAEGLEAERIVIGHCDDARAVDLERDRGFAEEGAYVAYDHVGWEEGAAHAMPDETRVALVKAMVESGYAERVVVSCSAVGAAMGLPASRHDYGRLLADFVPRLERAGVGEDAVETLLAGNPRRLLRRVQDEYAAAQLRAFAQGFRSASRKGWDV
jgi:phosphotriesterase-related protein